MLRDDPFGKVNKRHLGTAPPPSGIHPIVTKRALACCQARSQAGGRRDRIGRVSDNAYAETIALIERLHRRFLDVLRVELERLGIDQINNVQSLLLANIGNEEVSVGELMTRGYYLGSNVTYNLKRLVEAGFVEQQRSRHDRRVMRVRLTERGHALCAEITAMLARHDAALRSRPRLAPLGELNDRLRSLESFWTEQLSRPPAISALGDLAEQYAAQGTGH
jgi:DNA-binding MarR family transcriptional regulator